MARKRARVRCTAKRRNGEQCGNYAVTGLPTCRMHGSGGAKKGRPQLTSGLKHGRFAFRFRKALSEQGVERIEELSNSPQVLDLQRTVALSQFAMEQHLDFAPTDEEIEALAKMRLKLERAPTPAECQAVRLDLLATLHKAIDTHAGIQEKAKKDLSREALLGLLVVPILATLATETMKVILRHVDKATAEKIQAEIIDVRRNLTIKANTQMEAAR